MKIYPIDVQRPLNNVDIKYTHRNTYILTRSYMAAMSCAYTYCQASQPSVLLLHTCLHAYTCTCRLIPSHLCTGQSRPSRHAHASGLFKLLGAETRRCGDAETRRRNSQGCLQLGTVARDTERAREQPEGRGTLANAMKLHCLQKRQNKRETSQEPRNVHFCADNNDLLTTDKPSPDSVEQSRLYYTSKFAAISHFGAP